MNACFLLQNNDEVVYAGFENDTPLGGRATLMHILVTVLMLRTYM